VELSARHDASRLTLAEAEALYKFSNFTGFLDAFKAVCQRLVTPEDYELAAWRMIEQLAAQGVVHAEVYVSVGVIYMSRNHDPAAFEPIFAGLERARERGQRELGLTLYWIFDAVRHFYRRRGRAGLPQGRRDAAPIPLNRRHRPGRRRAARRL